MSDTQDLGFDHESELEEPIEEYTEEQLKAMSAYERLAVRAQRAKRIQSKNDATHMVPVRHPQQTFFSTELFTDTAFKDDVASMEHPIFTLSTNDKTPKEYVVGDTTIKILPTVGMGLATVLDKDIWIYCISKLVQAINEEAEISRTVRFKAYDLLVATNRSTGGVSYSRLKDSLDRLIGTKIFTNVKTGGKRSASAFGLLDSYSIVENDSSGKMVSIEVTLPDWLYRSVTSKSVLTISSDYFRLRKTIDRRLYELARKYCGNQSSWKISLPLLLEKTGSTTILRKFRASVKSLEETGAFPDYTVSIDSSDMVTFTRRKKAVFVKGGMAIK